MDDSFPALAQRVTVFGSTRNIEATSAGVSSFSAFSWTVFTLPPLRERPKPLLDPLRGEIMAQNGIVAQGRFGRYPGVSGGSQFRDSWLRTSAHRPATIWYSSAERARSPDARAAMASWISWALLSLSSSSHVNRSATLP